MKMKWQKPHLVVLVRGKPEENVLGTCKKAGSATDNSGTHDGCKDTSPCGNCDTEVSS